MTSRERTICCLWGDAGEGKRGDCSQAGHGSQSWGDRPVVWQAGGLLPLRRRLQENMWAGQSAMPCFVLGVYTVLFASTCQRSPTCLDCTICCNWGDAGNGKG